MQEITINQIRSFLSDCKVAYYESMAHDNDAGLNHADSDSDTLILTHRKTISERIIDAYHFYIMDKVNDVFLAIGETDSVIEFQNLLLENWQFVKGTLLCYTALPDHMATRLLIKIAYFVAQKTECPIVTCLMPTLATESIHEKFTDLDTQLPIRQLLRTHIVSDHGDYLIPARALTLYELSSGPIGKLLNPYFDFSKHPGDYVFFSEKEMARLKMHSPESEAFFNLIERYHDLLTKEDNLLLRLQTLVRLMSLNSVNGLGSELTAARGGMIAIADFFEYYRALNPAEILKVPRHIREELDILLDHSVPHPVLDDAGNPCFDEEGHPIVVLKNSDISSCLGMRSERLRNGIPGYEKRLYDIGLSDATKAEQREQLQLDIQTAYATLESLNYKGSEQLGFTANILSVLHVPFLMTFDDLKLFNLITPEEVAVFCKLPYFTDHFIQQINNPDDLLLLVTEWNAATIRAAFTVMGNRLARALRFNNDNQGMFFSILSTLDLEKCRAMLDGFQYFIRYSVRINQQLRFLNTLPDTHYQLFCEVTHAKWARLFTSIENIKHFFYYQKDNLSHCDIALTYFATFIKNRCTSPQHFATIIYNLYEPPINLIYQHLKSHLITLVVDFNTLMPMMRLLPDDNRKDYIDALAAQLPTVIADKHQLLQLMQSLQAADCDQILRILGQAHINPYFSSVREKRTFVDAIDQEKQATIYPHIFPAPQRTAVRRPRDAFFASHNNTSANEENEENEQRQARRHRRE